MRTGDFESDGKRTALHYHAILVVAAVELHHDGLSLCLSGSKLMCLACILIVPVKIFLCFNSDGGGELAVLVPQSNSGVTAHRCIVFLNGVAVAVDTFHLDVAQQLLDQVLAFCFPLCGIGNVLGDGFGYFRRPALEDIAIMRGVDTVVVRRGLRAAFQVAVNLIREIGSASAVGVGDGVLLGRRGAACLRRHGQVGEDPHGAVGTVAGIAFIALIIHEFTVDFQLGVGSEYISGIFIFDIAHSHHIHTIMIGLSGFKSGDFIFINSASPLRLCRNQAGIAVQLPPFTTVYVVYTVGHLAGEHRLVAVLEADGDIVDLHYINDGHSRHGDRFNGRDIHGTADERCGHFLSVHGNDGFTAEGIPVFRLQHKGIHIALAAFKFRDGRQRTVGAVVGIPSGNGFVVFKLLPAFIGDLIFVHIVNSYPCHCLRCITRLIIEFCILNRRRSDGTFRLTVFLHDQVIGVVICLIFVNIGKFRENTGRIRVLIEILLCRF